MASGSTEACAWQRLRWGELGACHGSGYSELDAICGKPGMAQDGQVPAAGDMGQAELGAAAVVGLSVVQDPHGDCARGSRCWP